MAPLDIPHHWKQIKDKLEHVLQENEDTSDPEDMSDSDDTTSSVDVSDIEDIIALVLHEDFPGSVADSIEFYPLSEDEDENTTPVLHDVPDARRRLFDSSSGEEDDDDDGVAYLDD
jgi:hypothetical protein